jgi:predicted transcriptional regulator
MVIIYLDDLNSIASKIRKARIVLGLSQAKLAKIAKVSQGTIARIEKDPIGLNPSYSMVYRIVEAINSVENENDNISNLPIKDFISKRLFYVSPDDSVAKALKIMKENDFSQIPVLKDSNNIVGTVYQKDLVKFAKNVKISSAKVREVMDTPLPEVDANSKIGMIGPILEEWGAVIVKKGKKIEGIFTIYDLLKLVKIS